MTCHGVAWYGTRWVKVHHRPWASGTAPIGTGYYRGQLSVATSGNTASILYSSSWEDQHVRMTLTLELDPPCHTRLLQALSSWCTCKTCWRAATVQTPGPPRQQRSCACSTSSTTCRGSRTCVYDRDLTPRFVFWLFSVESLPPWMHVRRVCRSLRSR